MSSIYKNGDYWFYQSSFEIDGRLKRFQKTLKTKDEKVARKRQQIYDRKYEDLKNPFLNTRELFSKTKEEYIEYRKKQVKRLIRSQRTLDSDKGVLKSFEDFIKNKYGEIYLNEIRKKDIEDYKEKRLEQDGVSVTTLGVNLRHLKSFFSYLKKKDKIENSPMEGVEIEAGERREFVPLDEDWKTLYEYLSEEMKSPRYDWFRTLIWILVNTGMRMGEARILKWNQGKSDYGRKMAKNYVYLSPDCSKITIYYKRSLRTIPVEHIKEIFNKIPKSKIVYKGKSREQKVEFVYVFENPISRTPHDHPNMTRIFKTLMVELELNQQYTPHSLRHGFVSFLANNGESIFNISKIVGHSVKEVTEFIYAHHTPKNLEKTMSKISKV
jgi:integrase/recombinase XerC